MALRRVGLRQPEIVQPFPESIDKLRQRYVVASIEELKEWNIRNIKVVT
jgi:hypothetical protein